jgi:hypothetical protein
VGPPEPDLTLAIAAALKALEDCGVPGERVVLAVTAAHGDDDEGTPYETHVGRTENDDTAVSLHLLAKDLEREAQKQSMALYGAESCPVCGSPRWALERARREPREGERPGVYVESWRQCMDCGHRGPK